MIRRVFWFAVGAGVGVYVVIKVRQQLQRANPEALGHRVAESAGSATASAREFVGRARAAMVEREAEIRDSFGLPD